MKAKAGDRLILEGTHAGDQGRVGTITEVRGVEGGPPYMVRWLDNDHVALVYPGPEARVESRLVRSQT